jgi:hypothetical protein
MWLGIGNHEIKKSSDMMLYNSSWTPYAVWNQEDPRQVNEKVTDCDPEKGRKVLSCPSVCNVKISRHVEYHGPVPAHYIEYIKWYLFRMEERTRALSRDAKPLRGACEFTTRTYQNNEIEKVMAVSRPVVSMNRKSR